MNTSETSGGVTRRTLLKCGATLAGGGALAAPLTEARTRRVSKRDNQRNGLRRSKQPINVIFLVSDGMSMGVPSLAEPFSQLIRDHGTHWFALADDPRVTHGYLRTAAANTMVTDSAAASSAWGSGQRINNGAINIHPDGTRLTPIGHRLHRAERPLGLVTTTRLTHATPAGFAAVQTSRNDEDEIAQQYLDVVDVALGGGARHFSADERADHRDVLGEYEAAGFRVCRTAAALRDIAARDDDEKILGLFDDSHLPFVLDQPPGNGPANAIADLATMTRVALDRLARRGKGFLLQVEGGRVDHAGHRNDAASLLHEQLAFDDAIGVALAFAQEHPDTLVVVTSDHGTANPGLIGLGHRYADSTNSFKRLAHIQRSFDGMYADLNDHANGDLSVERVVAYIHQQTGITLREREARAVNDAIHGEQPCDLHEQHRNFIGALSQSLGNHTGIGWTGTAHTSDLAPLLAIGPGAEQFSGCYHHTHVHDALIEMMNLQGAAVPK